MNNIKLSTRLTQEDYIKVNFHLLYRKLSIKIFTGIWIFVLLISLTTFLDGRILETWPQILFIVAFVSALPAVTYFSAKSNYKSNQRISETILYEFSDDIMITTGESFSANLTWEKVYSVTETKNWVLIWQNKQVANIVPKRDFYNDDLLRFKEIVRKHKGVKNKLKYD